MNGMLPNGGSTPVPIPLPPELENPPSASGTRNPPPGTPIAPKPLKADPRNTEDEEVLPSLSDLLLSTAQSLQVNQQGDPSNPPTVGPFLSTDPSFEPYTLLTPSTLSEPSSSTYLSQLLSLPLTQLSSEPTNLSQLSNSLISDLSSLSFRSLPAFLISHQTILSINSSFSTLSDSLTELIDSTTSLSKSCQEFSQRTKETREEREKVSRVKERTESCVEILGLSKLIGTCVRGGYWNEAIELTLKAVELEERHRESGNDGERKAGALMVLEKVREEVEDEMKVLRLKVLEGLRERGIKLPGAVRSLGLLRRMNAGVFSSDRTKGRRRRRKERQRIGNVNERDDQGEVEEREGENESQSTTEEELRLILLTSRWECLRSSLEQLQHSSFAHSAPTSSATTIPSLGTLEGSEERVRYLKRWIEVWREIVGDTVGMYIEIFASPSSFSSSLSPTLPSKPLPSTNSQASASNESDFPQPGLHTLLSPLQTFLSHSLTHLLSTLSLHLPHIIPISSLSSLLTQLTYCSTSFSRWGFEFAPIVRSLIEARVGEVIALRFDIGAREFADEVRDSFGGFPASLSKNPAGRNKSSEEVYKNFEETILAPDSKTKVLTLSVPPPKPPASATKDSTSTVSVSHQPPHDLILFPSLARLLNSQATSLNEIRLLPSENLYFGIRESQEKALESAGETVSGMIEEFLVEDQDDVGGPGGIRIQGEDGEGEGSGEDWETRISKQETLTILSRFAALFSRVLIPWCESGLRLAVYANSRGFVSVEGIGDGQRLERMTRRLEGLVERLGRRIDGEGREGGKGETGKGVQGEGDKVKMNGDEKEDPSPYTVEDAPATAAEESGMGKP